MKRRVGLRPIWTWTSVIFIFVLIGILIGTIAQAATGRQLQFQNIPVVLQHQLEEKFPEAFSPSAKYSSYDKIIRYLMATEKFETVIVESHPKKDPNVFIVVGKPVRRVSSVNVIGNHVLNTTTVSNLLEIKAGDLFLRKNLISGAESLKKAYARLGYLNTTIEINFGNGKHDEIAVSIKISEGEPCKISNIEFVTPNVKLKKALADKDRRHRGDLLTSTNLTNIRDQAENYFDHHRYLNAQLSQPQVNYNPQKTQAQVIFNVENPYRYELIFEGNSKLTSGDILRGLDLKSYPRTTLNPPLDLTNRITDIYHRRGYAQVQIDYKDKFRPANFVHEIDFHIKENRRVRISSIQLSGRLSRPSSYYAKFIRNNSTDLLKEGYYNRADFDLAMTNLQTELQNQGFLRVKIISFRAIYSKDKSHVRVEINLDEGPITQITSVGFEGNKSYTAKQLADHVSLKPGSSLKLADIESSLQTLTNFYTSRGYIEMKILNEKQNLIQYSKDNTRAAIMFKIYEGPKVKVASIAVEGNTTTKTEIILRELDFKVGDILTPDEISTSVARLQRLGLFSQANITTVEHGTNISDRTVLVTVMETNPGSFSAGLGLNNEFGVQYPTYHGFLGLAYRNLGGTARAVSGRVDLNYASDPQISYIENKENVSYLEPFLFKTRTAARASLTRSQNVACVDSATCGITTSQQTQNNLVTIYQSTDGHIYIERDLTLHTHFTWTAYGYELWRIFEKHNEFPAVDTVVGSIGPTIDVDYRDNPFNPTKGFFARWSLEYAAPWLGSTRTVNYIKTDAQYTYYWRLHNSPMLVWANQIRGGYLKNLDTLPNSGVPVFKSFFLGGRTTIRGFEPSTERFPNQYELNRDHLSSFPLQDFVMPTESEFYLVKSEIRFPLYGNLQGAIFYDGGAVTIADYIFPVYYRDAAGFGLRYSTPFGPVNAEIAWKLNRQKEFGESETRFDFSIGTF